MNKTVFASLTALCCVFGFSLSAQAQGKMKDGKGGGMKLSPAAVRSLKQLEAVNGKPLTEAQKKTIIEAAMARGKAMKPINDRFEATVAKAMGMTPEQFKKKVADSRKKAALKGK